MRSYTKKLVPILVMTLLLCLCATLAGAAVLGPNDPPRITLEEVRQMLDRGEVVLFIDTRAESQWQNASHKIPGAIRLTSNQDILDLARDYPADTAIVTYCT
jgi:3-mercaptopyruvate sulfurtransferase SseA